MIHHGRLVLMETARKPKARNYWAYRYGQRNFGASGSGDDSVEAFDRPFLLLLRHRRSGALLVAGLVHRPVALGPVEPGPCKEPVLPSRRPQRSYRIPGYGMTYR